jgi:hypothetical protein
MLPWAEYGNNIGSANQLKKMTKKINEVEMVFLGSFNSKVFLPKVTV